MIEQMLKDPGAKITEDFFVTVLGNTYPVWKKFNESLVQYGVEIEWRFYKDGGWLGKSTHKKKTVFWGSLSENAFHASFNFSNKPSLREGFLALEIDDSIKNSLEETPSGKYFGFTVNVTDENNLSDLYKLIEYKKTAK